MYSKAIKSINEPTIKNTSTNVNGTNKAATSCTVATCKSIAPSGGCIIM